MEIEGEREREGGGRERGREGGGREREGGRGRGREREGWRESDRKRKEEKIYNLHQLSDNYMYMYS